MNARSRRLNVESLDGRIVPSTVAYGDINHDGLTDRAEITSPTTITVSLGNMNGGYTVSAVLTTQNNRPLQNVDLIDTDADGDLDVVAFGRNGNNLYYHTWLGLGDGAFGARQTVRFQPPHGPGQWV